MAAAKPKSAEEAFQVIKDVRSEFPGHLILQTQSLVGFPPMWDKNTSTLLDKESSARIDATVVILRHVYSKLPLKLRGDPEASTEALITTMKAEESQHALLRHIWGAFKQTSKGNANQFEHDIIRKQIAVDFLGSEPTREQQHEVTCANLLWSPAMVNTLWKRPGFALWPQTPCFDPWRKGECFEGYVHWAGDGCLGEHVGKGLQKVNAHFTEPQVLAVQYHCLKPTTLAGIRNIMVPVGERRIRYRLSAVVTTDGANTSQTIDRIRCWDAVGELLPRPQHADPYCLKKAEIGFETEGGHFLLFYCLGMSLDETPAAVPHRKDYHRTIKIMYELVHRKSNVDAE